MDTSSNDAIRFAHEDNNYGASSSTNWYVLLFAVIMTLFAVYWGFVRPTSRQLTKLRRYVTSLESSIADLNVQRAKNGDAMSMLEKMVDHERTTNQATAALREMRELHRQVVQESEQLAAATAALNSLGDLRTRVARQSTLIESTERALGSIELLHTQVNDAATETEAAKLALEKVNVLRDGLIEGINQLNDAEPITSRVEELHMQLTSTGDQLDALFELKNKIEAQASTLERADTTLDKMATLQEGVLDQSETVTTAIETLELVKNKIEAQASTLEQADTTLDKMVTLQEGVLNQSETVAAAIETLELATDVELEMQRAGDTFRGMRHMLTEMVMMKPALMQAMDSLQPLAELSNLRRLGVDELRRVASVIATRHSAVAHSIVEPETYVSVAPIYSETVEDQPESTEDESSEMVAMPIEASVADLETSLVATTDAVADLDALVADSLEQPTYVESDEPEAIADDVEILADASETTVK